MTLGTYKVRCAYELKPRKGINKYTPEEGEEDPLQERGRSQQARKEVVVVLF